MRKLISFMLLMITCFSTTVLAKASAPNYNFDESALKTLNNLKNIAVTTDELSLFKVSDEDLKELAKVYKNVETGYFLRNNDRTLTEQEALEELNKYNSGVNFSFSIKDANENLVGELILASLCPKLFNVAYWILPEFRGHGYAAKACELLIRSANKMEPGLSFLISLDTKNFSSKRVAEKLQAALTSKNNAESADDSQKSHYEILKVPFKLKYKISPLDENNMEFKFEMFVNNEKTGSAVYTKEQIEKFTYKKIFDLKEIEINRLNYLIGFVH